MKAYAHDLTDWFVFLEHRGLDWQEVQLEDAGEFVAWLRLPPAGRDGRVVVLQSAQGHCGDATVNRKLSAVSASSTPTTSAGGPERSASAFNNWPNSSAVPTPSAP